MVLTGDIIPAVEAERLGGGTRSLPDEQLEEATLKLASKLAAKSPLALQIGKVGVYGMADLPYHRALDYVGELFASLGRVTNVRVLHRGRPRGIGGFFGKARAGLEGEIVKGREQAGREANEGSSLNVQYSVYRCRPRRRADDGRYR
jgi:hypothetical protein